MIDAPNLDLPPEITGYQELKPHCVFEANQRFFTV
jgi:aldose 1-epimerase